MKPTLRLEILHDPSSFWSLKDEWMSLVERVPGTTPFMTPHWTGLSFEYFASDEELDLVLLYNERGELVGVVPLVRMREDGSRKISLLQNWDVTPYADWLVLPQYRAVALQTIFRHFHSMYGEGGMVLSLQFLREDSPIVTSLERLSEEVGIPLTKMEAYRIREIFLPRTFEKFLYGLKSPLRKKLQKSVSKLERQFNMRHRFLEDPEEINENLDPFFRLFRNSLTGKSFLTPGREAFFREIFLLMAREGWFKLSLMEAKGWRISAFAILDFSETFYLYMLGMDPGAKDFSPIDLHLYYLIVEAIRRGKGKIQMLEATERSDLASVGKRVRIIQWVLGESQDIPKRPFLLGRSSH